MLAWQAFLFPCLTDCWSVSKQKCDLERRIWERHEPYPPCWWPVWTTHGIILNIMHILLHCTAPFVPFCICTLVFTRASHLKHLPDHDQFIHNLFLSGITIACFAQQKVKPLRRRKARILHWSNTYFSVTTYMALGADGSKFNSGYTQICFLRITKIFTSALLFLKLIYMP